MKIYLKQKEVETLQKEGQLLTRDQIITLLEKQGEKVSDNLILRFLDYRNNPIAPEKFAYRLSWISVFSGKREQGTYWPFSVGMQA